MISAFFQTTHMYLGVLTAFKSFLKLRVAAYLSFRKLSVGRPRMVVGFQRIGIELYTSFLLAGNVKLKFS